MNTTSLSINPSLSPPFLSPPNTTSFSYSHHSARFHRFQTLGAKPILPFGRKARLCSLQGPKIVKSVKLLTKMTIAEDSLLEVVEDPEEGPPESAEDNSRPRRIALFVEPSPFA